ncbi:MAG TPA: chorismate mutase [Acidimicrobiales bacterium]|jgi:chorismate mutase|nr:chorismate mutase [Acidimicrobiales bacterium]
MPVRALRGATTLDEDTPEQMYTRVKELFAALFERNRLESDDIISIFLTATPDLGSAFPATAARAFGLEDVPLLGAQELDVEGAMPRCVRVLLHIETDRSRSELEHVFLEGAIHLRPDLKRD